MTTTPASTLPAELAALARIATEAGRHVEASAMRRAALTLARLIDACEDVASDVDRTIGRDVVVHRIHFHRMLEALTIAYGENS